MLVIFLPTCILDRVYFPLPENLIMWHATHESLDGIPSIDACEMKTGVFFL
jgi:hypothetical protein